ncbi:ATP-dependent helicase HrpB [Catenovulum agarivorans DS-2]|uniref:ATP-dependent helicase HrpB n=1 Tax=Catenovulum agarivorans DS-2 TaxID=1328313 RepID=W7QQH5_9ALTE|nr:ATP-dependent helicase HrpB [Catenovulum agarivorans]EWH11242.1 ATP-dependent helicase HrpB [Catenovulum agarivorans DS-2]
MLPIQQHLAELQRLLTRQQNVVLQAEPGAGKSTAVPLFLLQAPWLRGKKIVMLEPRRVAAKSIAHFLANQLGEQVGQTVGYQVRNEHKISKQTRLEIVTEGVLTRRLQNDPELSDVGLIIFDEFHERSIHADLALMLALEVQEAYRDDLKMLVMSATIDTNQVSSYLNDAPVMQVAGRTFPVEVRYAGKPSGYLAESVIKQLQLVLADDSGDVLVFLPGQADINRCIALAEQRLENTVKLLPLYGALPLAQQELVLHKRVKEQARRVIFATNIAETSLTIDGITCVIDSGLEKVLTYDVKSGLSRLDTNYISKASATQRAGRAGRMQAGKCVRLWNQTEQQALADFQTEQISCTDLSSLVLELAAWGITDYADANWLTPPPLLHYQLACQLNQQLNLLDTNNKITAHGQQALGFAVSPRLASMLLHCQSPVEKALGCLLAALLSERDILVNADTVDISQRLLLLIDYVQNKQSTRAAVKFKQYTVKQVLILARSFAQKLSFTIDFSVLTLADIQQYTGVLLLHAYPDRLAKARGPNAAASNNYLLANGRGVSLRDSDAMLGQTWLVVCDCDGRNKDGVIFIAGQIAQAQVETALAGKLIEQTHYRLDDKNQSIIGRRRRCYGAIVLSEENLSQIPTAEFSACVKDIVKSQGLSFLNWTKRCQAWLQRAQWLANYLDDFPKISAEYLLAQIDTWLLPYINSITSIKQLKQLDIYDLLVANLTWEQQQLLQQYAPENYQTPSGKSVVINYDEAQGPTVSVILQEMFGQLASPKLANEQVPLRFELLSPARRPIQTTSDLANFWRSSYFDVAKEMRGRYPKHRWPEKPLEEKPGRSIKLRSH